MGDEPDDRPPADDGASDADDRPPADDEDVVYSEELDLDPIEPTVTDVNADNAGDAGNGEHAGTADDEDGNGNGNGDGDELGPGEAVADVSVDSGTVEHVEEADGGYADAPGEVPESNAPSVPDEADFPEEVEEDGIFGEGPASDEELPLADHVEEMIRRLAVVLLVAGVISVGLFPFGDNVITYIWYGVLPAGTTAQPHIYAPLELLVTQFKVASIAGLIVALPVFVYETYAFMKPGLYPHERRYYLAAIPTSLVLAVVGVAFAYFVVVPAVMTYFLFYSQSVATAALALGSTFNLILILMAYLAIVFQIPLFVMLAIMMGLTSRRWLADKRLLFWGAFAGVSFIMTPDPTGVAPVVVAATMIVLFEGTLLLLRWTDRSPTPA